jgi:hypothetical protein
MKSYKGTELGTISRFTFLLPIASIGKCKEISGAKAFANSAVTQASEDDLVEQALGAFANLATATAFDRNVVAQLTEANSRLAKQLEDNAISLKEVKTLLKKERAERASGGNTDRPPR